MRPLTFLNQARDKGLRRSARLGLSILRTQTTTHTRKASRQFLFLSHTIDNSGAPQVLMQMVEETAALIEPSQVHVVSPQIRPDQLRALERLGVRIDKTAVLGTRLVKLQLGIKRDDFVLMNTTAVREYYQRFILRALRTGALAHAFWFIHEEATQLRESAPFFLEAEFTNQVRQLVEDELLTILVPSLRVKTLYDEVLSTDKVRVMPLRLDIAENYCAPRAVEEYEQLDFLMVGGSAGGRKGQLIALAAFQELLLTDIQRDPSRYRDFTLTLVGIGDDYVSRQIRTLGAAVLGSRLEVMPQVAPETVLEVTRRCNVVICSSINESFGLYVAEGMAMGHVVLRSDTGGSEEQLQPGVNGYAIDIGDIGQFASTIGRLLDRLAASNESLNAMGRASQEIIEPFRHGSYAAGLGLLDESLSQHRDALEAAGT
jgi:glycosyltransferase involved in cell wall biosynthesis